MTQQRDFFGKTIQHLEESLQVQHIATFDVVGCKAASAASSVLEQYPDFDNFPVREDGRVIGVLRRSDCEGTVPGLPAKQCMQPLSEEYLVTADYPLLSFLHLLTKEPSFRLVVEGTGVAGIVTLGDVPNLAVKLLAFSICTQVESILGKLIVARSLDDVAWMAHLDVDEENKLKQQLEKLRSKRENPAAIELATFDQKIRVAQSIYQWSFSEQWQLNEIRSLRNEIVHDHNYAESREDLVQFLSRLELAKSWMLERA